MIKVGVVGCGKMGLLHASLLSILPEVKICGLCDRSTIVRKFLRKIFEGVPIAADVGELSDLALDAIYVTTPIPTHYNIIKAIHSSELAPNIFVEKTLASNFEESRELCETSKSLGGQGVVGYHKRFSVTFRKAKSLLDMGVVGDIISFEAYAYSSDFVTNGNQSATSPRGGVLRDLGCHPIDLATWYFGDMSVTSATRPSKTDTISEDSAEFKVKTYNGIEGWFHTSWSVPGYRIPEVGLIIRGRDGVIKVNDDRVSIIQPHGGTSEWYRHSLNDDVPFLLGQPEYFREDNHFINLIKQNGGCEIGFDSASKVDNIIDQVKRAS